MSLYTKFGDGGETMLYGGTNVSKAHPRIHACGTIDELSAIIGGLLAGTIPLEAMSRLRGIQALLHTAGADLSTPLSSSAAVRRIEDAHVQMLEGWIDVLEEKTPVLRHFILPGGTAESAQIHFARAVCRRAERWIVAIAAEEEINNACLRFFNRLGDYLFALARWVNQEGGGKEVGVSGERCEESCA